MCRSSLICHGRTLIKETFSCYQYKTVDRWDLWPDPGHMGIRDRQAHAVNSSCQRFHDKYLDLNLGRCRRLATVKIRLLKKEE